MVRNKQKHFSKHMILHVNYIRINGERERERQGENKR